MKKQQKYKIISYAKNEHEEKQNCKLTPIYLNKRDVKGLLKQYPKSEACIWQYCCFGPYKNCWQEPIYTGNWDMTQNDVDCIISSLFKPDLLKKCRQDGRIFMLDEKTDNKFDIVIIARDLRKHKSDYFVTFMKENVKQPEYDGEDDGEEYDDDI